MSGDVGRELLILGLVRRSALSAYSIDRAVRGHSPLYRPLKSGNVYHDVARLATAGFLLSKRAAAARGRSEHKTVFRLSAVGERHFHALLSETIEDVQAPEPAIEIAYVLLGQLPRKRALELLLKRSVRVAEQERRLSRIVGDVRERTGGGFLGLSHTVARLRSERRFLRDSIALLKDPKWQAQWTSNDGPIVDGSRTL